MKPEWLKIQRRTSEQYSRVKHMIEQHALNTICSSGKCPNQFECWNRGTATFMILGNICTRNCKFCATITGKPLPPDSNEPQRIAESVAKLNLRHAVITSVTRDDLPDQGAQQWCDCIKAIREINPKTTIEVLTPDFNGDKALIDKIVSAQPDIISHNLETVERLTPLTRSRATYRMSLRVLTMMSESGIPTKTGIMVGLGEFEDEVAQTLHDAYQAGCRIITIGQYLQPTKSNLPVAEYVHPSIFAHYHHIAREIGFEHAVCGPLVRSSYHAEETIAHNAKNQ